MSTRLASGGRAIAFVGVMVGILAASAVEAQTASPGPTTGAPLPDDAAEHIARAEQHVISGRFAEALAEYERAYQISAAPELLFHIGQAHARLGHHERVIHVLSNFVRQAPNSENRPASEDLIAQAIQSIEAAEAAERERLREEERRREREEARRRAETLLELERERREEARQPLLEQWWFWAIAGGVAAVATVGVVALSAEDTVTVLPSGSLGTLDRR